MTYVNLYAKYPELVKMREFQTTNELIAFLQNRKRKTHRKPLALFVTGCMMGKPDTYIEKISVHHFDIGHHYISNSPGREGCITKFAGIHTTRKTSDHLLDIRSAADTNSWHLTKAAFTSKKAAEEFSEACINAYNNDPEWQAMYRAERKSWAYDDGY